MYTPRFVITNKILKNIGQIEGGREVIENAPLVPSFEKEFQTDAIIRTVFHGTHIEGNDLTLLQTKRVLEGEEVFGRPRDIQEVINYRNVINLLEELKHKRGTYSTDDLLDIHRVTVSRIIPIEKIGVLRTSEVIIREEGTGKVIFTPPSFVEVPYLLDGFFEWFNSEVGREVHPVIRAAIAHYILVSIHPFVEGNGRTVRAFTIFVLIREGYDIKKFYSIEEHFDNDLEAYYLAFSKVDNQSLNIAERDLTAWIEYFTEVLATEVVKIKERVRKLSIDTKFKVKLGEQVSLSERQMRIVEYLTDT
ncbi:Fic family protein, partial [Candidatus Woesebacteria bacterium]|nr:Fic family protein [Candidatus Woesebacteria bacterium]